MKLTNKYSDLVDRAVVDKIIGLCWWYETE